MFIGETRASEWRGGGVLSWRGFHWWPLPTAEIAADVPVGIRSAFAEAVKALAADCPRASAVMARRTLEAVTDEKGQSTGPLAQRLRRMSDQGLLHSTLSDWANEVRLIGNSGAHFDPLDDVSKADAEQLVNFMFELLRYLYILPAQLAARRQPPPP